MSSYAKQTETNSLNSFAWSVQSKYAFFLSKLGSSIEPVHKR